MNSNTIGIVVLILMLIAGALIAVRCCNTGKSTPACDDAGHITRPRC